jgi:2-haloacid dehalogenase
VTVRPAVIAFDAYGTLLDVGAAAQIAAAEPGGADLAAVWPALSRDWRQKQLAYTWLRSLSGEYADFETVTADALDWALSAQGLADPALRVRMLSLYRVLPAYPEVPDALATLRSQGHRLTILSNGTGNMLTAALGSAGIAEVFDDVLSAERLQIYKPHPSVYRMVTDRFTCAPVDVLFVSSNGWDVAGAAAFGFRCIWVNRTGEPPDCLPGRPFCMVADISQVKECTG